MITKANPTGKQTIAQVVEVHASQQPEGIAFIAGEQSMTWRQYELWSSQLADVFLQSGLQSGERIAILLPDQLITHVAFLACEKAGVVGMAISSRAGIKEVRHLTNVSGSVALLGMPTHGEYQTTDLFHQLKRDCTSLQQLLLFHHAMDHAGAISVNGKEIDHRAVFKDLSKTGKKHSGPDDVFLLNTTSGTTGMPKCVVQHQRRWFEYAEYAQEGGELSAQDIFLRAVPASVGFGLWTGHFTPTLLGATTVILPKFSIEQLLEAIQAHKVTILVAVSTQFIMLLNHTELSRYDLSSLRIMYTGGEAVPYNRAAEFEKATGAVTLQFYGSNETGALSYTTLRDSRKQRLKTAGRIIPGMNVRLINNQEQDVTDSGRGQPVCKGLLTCEGYFNNEQANQKLFTSNGYMKMEDIVTLDAEGYLTVVGRVGDFIIRGGKNISAAAVEEAVLAHTKVNMAAAIAMPDPVFGERVCLYSVLEPGENLSLADLVKFLNDQGVSKEYFPEKMIQLDALPTVSGGKIAKQVLREDLKQRLAGKTDQ